MSGNFDWTVAKLEKLEQLWLGGTPTKAIGDQLGTSKNSVIGKAHRLGLPVRESPVKASDGSAAPRRARRAVPVPVRTLPPMRPTPAAKPAAPVAETAPPADAPRAVTTPPLFTYAGGGLGCAWVLRPWRIGDPPGSNTCGKPRRDAKCSWCEKHAADVFQRRPAAEDASWRA